MGIQIRDTGCRRAAGFLAALLLLLPSALSAREIIFPPDGALVEGESLTILGYRPKSAGNLSVTTGGAEKKHQAGPGIFSVTVTVKEGLTTIGMGEETVKVFFAGEGGGGEAASYRKPDLHAVDKIGSLMSDRRQIYDQVTELTQAIRSGG